MRTKKEDVSIEVIAVTQEEVTGLIHGTQPVILNRINDKAMRELLQPHGKKSVAEKKSAAKHDPLAEFRSAPYTIADPTAPTLLAMPGAAFKGALAKAALDLPGASKSQIGRLTFVPEWNVPIYGKPELFMSVTRNSDMNRTPDIRTRVIVPEWAAVLTVRYVTPLLQQKAVQNLLATAGVTIGVGDWRPEKGKGSFGQFELVSADNADLLRIMKEGGRAAQIEAMENPVCFDDDTRELLEWYTAEVARRGFKKSA